MYTDIHHKIHTLTHTHIHTNVHKCTQRHTHIHTHTHTHTQTNTCSHYGMYSSQIRDCHPAVLDGDMTAVLQLKKKRILLRHENYFETIYTFFYTKESLVRHRLAHMA